MRVVLVLVLALVTGCSGAAHPQPPPANHVAGNPPSHEPMASLERTPCFGWCPSYTVTVYRDGVVEYMGKDWVKVKGAATGRITATQLDELDRLFRDNGYLDLADTYQIGSVTDMPSAHTSYTPAGGRTKTVAHYLGDGHAPPSLEAIEDGIDRIVHIEAWIGTDKEREKLSGR